MDNFIKDVDFWVNKKMRQLDAVNLVLAKGVSDEVWEEIGYMILSSGVRGNTITIQYAGWILYDSRRRKVEAEEYNKGIEQACDELEKGSYEEL